MEAGAEHWEHWGKTASPWGSGGFEWYFKGDGFLKDKFRPCRKNISLFPGMGMDSLQPLKMEPLHNFHFLSRVPKMHQNQVLFWLRVFSAGGRCFWVEQSIAEDSEAVLKDEEM